MTTINEIPTKPYARTTTISLAGVTYTLNFYYNNTVYGGGLPNPCWLVDIEDQFGKAILTAVPLITGADLLSQFGYLGIGGALLCQSDFDPTVVPSFTSLGSTGHLYFATNP
jgi:hypothetical protein